MNNTTEQDVLKFLRSKCHESGCTDSCMHGDAYCSLALAIHSIEKRIAKKPRFYARNFYCRECGHHLGSNLFECRRILYCDNCGQKLDWKIDLVILHKSFCEHCTMTIIGLLWYSNLARNSKGGNGMTIRELLTTNPFIVEVYITLRGDYVNGMYHKHQFVHEYGIGTCATFGNAAIMCHYQEGVRSKIFKNPSTLLKREINKRASVPMWDIKEKSLPDFLLDLEVGYWNAVAATQWIHLQDCTGYDSASTIKIDVYLPEDMEKLPIGRQTEVLLHG